MPVTINQEFLLRACQTRPDYRIICDQTREGLAAYFEGEALKRLIIQWPKEEQEKFVWRCTQMLDNYDNYVKEIAEAYVEGVFRTKTPTRKTGNAKLDTYLGEDYSDWFMQEFAPFALFLPEIYVITTMPPAAGPIHSRADAEELQGLPYPTIVFPHYCANFGFDASGQMEWCCFFRDEPPVKKPNATEGDAKAKSQIVFELYTADHYCLFNGDGDFMPNPDGSKGPIEHGYNFLPVERVTYRANLSLTDSRRAGYAFMHSIVKITLGGLTAKGVLYDYIHYSLFPKLVASEGTIENMIEAGVGANKPLAVPNVDKDVLPSYLEAPVREFEALERMCYERIPTAVYRAARLRDRSTNKAIASSGISKMFDMVPELGVLKALAKYFKKADIAIVRSLARMAGAENVDNVSIEYPVTFDTKSVVELMAEYTEFGSALKASALPSSPTGAAILSERAYRALLPDATEKEIKLINEEIQAALAAGPVIDEPNPDGDLNNGDPTDPTILPKSGGTK
jgi:hypothetical protein